MEKSSSNQETPPQTGIQKIVSKWIQHYAPNFERNPEVDRKMEELTVNYMSLLLVKSAEIADFNGAENIEASHVFSGIQTLDENKGMVTGRELYWIWVLRVLKGF
jgi:hypothetical protein